MATVLLVEDYPSNILVASLILERMGILYDVAQNSDEVFNRLNQQQYDAILMDVSIPGLTGLEVTQKIREHEKKSNSKIHIPIIGMTAHVMSGDHQRCLDSGMSDYLPKPYTPQMLEEKLSYFLAKKAA